MAKVLITFQIMPKSADSDLDKIKVQIKELKDIGEVKEIKEEPIAFGLKSLQMLTIAEDEAGVTDRIENKIKSIDEVKEVRVISATLL